MRVMENWHHFRFVHEYAAIYLAASIESILEELVTKCLEWNRGHKDKPLTSALLEEVVASSSDFWGLFQPYSHLSSCRTAAGLAVPSSLEEVTGATANGSQAMSRSGEYRAQISMHTIRYIYLLR